MLTSHFAHRMCRRHPEAQRSAACDAVTGDGRGWRLSCGQALHYARSVCDASPLRCPATPSRDTVLRPSWDAPYCAAYTVCMLPPQVPTTDGGLSRRSVRSCAHCLHYCKYRVAVLERLLCPRCRKNLRQTAQGRTLAAKVL